jgi:hypothetical protein
MPVISALNLTDLVVHLFHTEGLTVDCHELKTLKTVLFLKDLRVNGMKFYELSSMIRGFEMESGNNLIEFSLHSRSYPAPYSPLNRYGYNFSVNRFLELVGRLRSLKVLVIDLSYAFDEKKRIVVPMFNLLSRIPNLERLHLRGQLILVRE